jgi:hypothetical protein
MEGFGRMLAKIKNLLSRFKELSTWIGIAVAVVTGLQAYAAGGDIWTVIYSAIAAIAIVLKEGVKK